MVRRRRVSDDKFAALVGAGQREGRYRIDIPRAVLVANFFSDLLFLPRWYSASRAHRTCQYQYCQHLDERVNKAELDDAGIAYLPEIDHHTLEIHNAALAVKAT